jgi:hypothetical protein
MLDALQRTVRSFARPALSGRSNAVAPEVLEVERPQHVRNVSPASLGDIVYVRAELHHIGFRLVELAGGSLGGWQETHQLPEEADVEMVLRAGDREVVQLRRREALEIIVITHPPGLYAAIAQRALMLLHGGIRVASLSATIELISAAMRDKQQSGATPSGCCVCLNAAVRSTEIALLLFVHLSSERTLEPVRKDCSSAEKQQRAGRSAPSVRTAQLRGTLAAAAFAGVGSMHLPLASRRSLTRSELDERRLTMGEISMRVRAVRDRLTKRRSERRAASGERALKRKQAAATRLRHERLDDKMPR